MNPFTDRTAPWFEQAVREMVGGVTEKAGPADESRIVELYHRFGSEWDPISGDEDAWCSSFVNACLELVFVEGTQKPNARSFLKWGVPIAAPRPGCVVVFWRESPESWKGHVGFYVGEARIQGIEYVVCLGGNQRNAVNVALIRKHRVLTYRWPSEE